MNIFLNEYFGFCFELNFELNHFSARFNEKNEFSKRIEQGYIGWISIKTQQSDETFECSLKIVARHFF